jgi:hypothetical protein
MASAGRTFSKEDVQEFEAFEDYFETEVFKNGRYMDEVLEEKWPHERQKGTDFLFWSSQDWVTQREIDDTPISGDEFNRMIREGDFRENGAGDVLWAVELRGVETVALGYTRVDGGRLNCRLVPCAYFLWPNKDCPMSTPGLLEKVVLGVNLDIHIKPICQDQPKDSESESRRRKGDGSSGEESVVSADTTQIRRENGFAFVQLGMLQVQEPSEVGTWMSTRYGVVARLNVHGKAGEIYLIYNFHVDPAAEDEPINFREHVQVLDESGQFRHDICRVGNSQRFTIARIGHSLEDLAAGKSFEIAVVETEECQLVRARRLEGEMGIFVLRAYVKEDDYAADEN